MDLENCLRVFSDMASAIGSTEMILSAEYRTRLGSPRRDRGDGRVGAQNEQCSRQGGRSNFVKREDREESSAKATCENTTMLSVTNSLENWVRVPSDIDKAMGSTS